MQAAVVAAAGFKAARVYIAIGAQANSKQTVVIDGGNRR